MRGIVSFFCDVLFPVICNIVSNFTVAKAAILTEPFSNSGLRKRPRLEELSRATKRVVTVAPDLAISALKQSTFE